MEVQAVVEAQAAMREQASDQRVSERPIACERDSEKEEREQEGGRTCVCVCVRARAFGTGNSVEGEGRDRRPVTAPPRGLSLSLTHILCARKSIRICAHSKDPTLSRNGALQTLLRSKV